MESVQGNKLSTSCSLRTGQGSGSTARSLEEIPEKYRHIFHGYKNFNLVQSKVLDDVLYTNKSIIISAPTGSGKTAVFELAIIKFLMNQPEGSNFKIVYVAPIKALCSEKYLDWSKKFTPLGVSCREATGDTDFGDLSELEHTCLVITTPEKWDSLTRKWRDYEDVFGSISLFLIDEVHLLSEDIRGPILETIVSRMKTIQFSMNLNHKTGSSLRFVAASATIPNIEDLATWLSRGSENSVSYFRISDENRPVQLEKYILGFISNSGGFKFDMSLNYKLSGIIRKYSMGKPTLIFCSSRKSVEMASAELFKSSPVVLSDNHKAALITLSKRLQDSKLQNLVLKGISYHHAGLGHDDRNIIEEAFKISLLLILVSTSTLAMGVNLPAHLVIIKSTATFLRGSAEEYKESAMLQMIGRAGRPQFDTKGVAVIMTEQKNVKKYENLMNGRTPVESHLHKHLAEHLNSEIVLQTITDLEVAMEWIRSTYLYVRAVKSPVTYGFAANMTRETVEKKLEEICLLQLNALETQDLIVKDQTFGMSVLATQFGRLMARYYLSFDTMKVFRTIRGDETFLEVFNTIISCKEFSDFTLRVSDKKTLNSLNTKCIKFPIKGRIKSVHDKISCLIQAVLSNIPVQESSLTLDALKMIRHGERIAKCLVDYIRLSYKNSNPKIYQALLNSVIIAKCLKARMWQDSEFVCKQLKKIGTVFSNLLIKAGKTTLKSLEETSTGALEMILGKPPPFGSEIHQGLAAFPEYEIMIKLEDIEFIKIVIKQIQCTFKYEGKNSILIIGDSENNLILFHEKIDTVISEFGIFEKVLKIPDMSASSIVVNLIHECLVGVDKSTTLILNYVEPSNDSKKINKRAQSTSRATRTRSNKKANKVSRTVRKTTTSKTATPKQYEELFEDTDYFEDIDEMEAVSDEGSNLNLNNNSISIHKTDSGKNTLQQKLNSFNYTERPKMSSSTVNKDDLLEMFDDDFDDTIKVLEDDVNRENEISREDVIFNVDDFSEEFNLPPNQEAQITDNLKYTEKKQRLISEFFSKKKNFSNPGQCIDRKQKELRENEIEIINRREITAIHCSNNNINSNTRAITKQPQTESLFQGKKYEMRCAEPQYSAQIPVWENSRETNKYELSSNPINNRINKESEKSETSNTALSLTAENNISSAQKRFVVSTNTKQTLTGNKEYVGFNQNPVRAVENSNLTLNVISDHGNNEQVIQPLNLCTRKNCSIDLLKQNPSQLGAKDYTMYKSSDSESSYSTNKEKTIPLIKEKESTLGSKIYNFYNSKNNPQYYELETVLTNDHSKEFPKRPLQVNIEKANQSLVGKESPLLPIAFNFERNESFQECSLPNKQRRVITEDVPNISMKLKEYNPEEYLSNHNHFKTEELPTWNFNSGIFGDVTNNANINCNKNNQFENNLFFSSRISKNENLLESFAEPFCKNKPKVEPLNSQGIKTNWKFQSLSEWLFYDDQRCPSKSSICNSTVSNKENVPLSSLFNKVGEDNQIRKALPMKPANIFGPVSNPTTNSKFFKLKSNFQIRKDNFLKISESVHYGPKTTEITSTLSNGTIKEKLDYNQHFKCRDDENFHGDNSFKRSEYGNTEKDQSNWEINATDRNRTTFAKNTAMIEEDEAIDSEIFTNNPSIDKITMTIIKQHKSLSILDILQVIVDSRLSKKVKTPLILNDLDINYSNESQESINFLKPKDTNFLTDNEEDKKYVYTNSVKSNIKSTFGSIVRLPDVKREKFENDDIKPNSGKGLLGVCLKLKPLTRPHNLNRSKMMRRQKTFLVPKTKKCDRINLGKSVVGGESFSSLAHREFKKILNGAEKTEEEQPMKELQNELDFKIENICDLFEEDKLEGNMYHHSVEEFPDEFPQRTPFDDDPFFEEQSTPFEDVPIISSSSSSRRYDDFFTSFSQRSRQVHSNVIEPDDHNIEL